MLRFLIDTQLPPSLAAYLTTKGYDAIHTTFFERGHLLKDAEISKIAINENRIIITKDGDFFERELTKLITLFSDTNNLVIFNRQQIISY